MRAAVAAAALLAGLASACLSPPGVAVDGAPPDPGDEDAAAVVLDAAPGDAAPPGCSLDLDFSGADQLDDWAGHDESACGCGIGDGQVLFDNSAGGDPTCRCFFVSPELALENTAATIQLSTPGDVGLAVSLTLDLRGVERSVYFSRTRDILYFGDCQAGECVNTAHGQVDFEVESMRWWRLTHDAGAQRVTFSTSPDGQSWTAQAFAPVTDQELEGAGLAIGAFDPAEAPAEVVGLDDLSLCDAP